MLDLEEVFAAEIIASEETFAEQAQEELDAILLQEELDAIILAEACQSV